MRDWKGRLLLVVAEVGVAAEITLSVGRDRILYEMRHFDPDEFDIQREEGRSFIKRQRTTKGRQRRSGYAEKRNKREKEMWLPLQLDILSNEWMDEIVSQTERTLDVGSRWIRMLVWMFLIDSYYISKEQEGTRGKRRREEKRMDS